ncbi:MAG: hypothetical protein R2761_14200 [Acidimicrobiales bacterium]
MITTTYTANALVAHRQAELRATGRSIGNARRARIAGRAGATPTPPAAGWSIPALAQRINLSARRRFALI